MFGSPSAGKSVDSLAELHSGPRAEFPYHGGGSSRPGARRGSTASSIRSIGGSLDPGSSHTSLHESGKNAISTLLQPPIVRTGLQAHILPPTSSTHKPPTARDIPPVSLTNIPHVETEEFTNYVSQFSSLYDQLRRLRASEAEASNNRRANKHDDGPEPGSGASYLRPGSRPSIVRKGSNASLSSITSIETAASPGRRSSSVMARKNAQGPPPLSTIPTVYFDEDFRLENPRTFDVVSERSEVIRPADGKGDANGTAPPPRKALATNAILQEKLSWYMDTIEVHLINSISNASTTFFTALGSLKELHSEAAESVQRIKVLREDLEALDREVVTQGLSIVQKRQRQENLRQLHEVVLQLKEIVDGIANCETLVDAGEVDKALEHIQSLDMLISGEHSASNESANLPCLHDLRGVSALQGVNSDLNTLRFRIGKAYETQFANILLEDLRRHTDSVSSPQVLMRWSNSASRARGGHGRSQSVFPSYLTQTEELKSQLLTTLVGLNRAQYVSAAAIGYREAVLREVRNLIRRPLPSSNDDDNESMMSASTAGGGRHLSSQEKSSILARNLRSLDPQDSEDLLVKIYVSVAETLRRLTTQTKVILDVASSLTDEPNTDGVKSPSARSPATSPRPDRYPGNSAASVPSFALQEELHKTLDVTNLLGQAVDVANDKIVKVLKVRSEQATALPLDFFLRYFTLNLYFANECEAISGRSGTILKNVVNSHIKDFVQKTRESEIQKLAQGMESDQWDARDLTDKHVQLISEITESSTQDAAKWVDKVKLEVPYHEIQAAAAEEDELSGGGATTEKSRSAVVDGEKFLLPNSAILCLEGTANFLHLIMGIPSMTMDIASSLIAYLQLFNSRCTQLILGAGATKSAGLKTITSKHLALASQALSFIAALIPHIREFIRRHAGSGAGVSGLMGEYDKIRRLLQDHQENIHQKLVDIMSGRAVLHAKSMRAIDWDAKQSENAHHYMEILTKETGKLYRVLSKHLPEQSIKMIMAPVFARYKEHIGKALQDADPKTQHGQDSMMVDIDLFNSKLGKLEGFGDAGDALTSIAKSKIVEPTKPKHVVAEEITPAKEDKSEESDPSSIPSEGDKQSPTSEQ